MDELETLRRENRELRAQIAQLIAQVARLADRVTELLAVAQRKHRKPPVEKPATVEGSSRRSEKRNGPLTLLARPGDKRRE